MTTPLYRPLPGPILDLVAAGTRLHDGRRDVVMAVRRVMLSAHRHGWPRQHVYGLLLDDRNALAVQIRTGKGGRTIPRAQVTRFLTRVWDDTARIAAQTAWDTEAVHGFIEYVRDQWAAARDRYDEREQLVVDVALELATAYGTTRPVLPQRVLAERTGIPQRTITRVLARLSDEGEWLRLVQRGNPRTRRASLYSLAPGMRGAYGRTTSAYEPPPTYEPPTYEPPASDLEESVMSMSITIAARNEDDLRQAIRVLSGSVTIEEQEPAPVLRLVQPAERS